MESIITIIIAGIAGIGVGFLIAKLLERNRASHMVKSAKKSAASIIKEANVEAESIKKDKILIRSLYGII